MAALWTPHYAFFAHSGIWNNSYCTCGEGNGTPLQYSCLENLMDGGAWWAAVHGLAKSRTRLSDFTFAFHFHALEKERATHSSVLAWRIPGTGEPSGLPSMGSHRVGHNWSDLAAIVALKIHSKYTNIFGTRMFPLNVTWINSVQSYTLYGNNSFLIQKRRKGPYRGKWLAYLAYLPNFQALP